MDTFSSKSDISLEKTIDTSKNLTETALEDIDSVYELKRCIQWIAENQYTTVCLQFPDYLLPNASEIAIRLQRVLSQIIYIMGDSAYESCCVDYITADHVNSDAIVHFGPRCLSSWTNKIPCLCIYDKEPMDLNLFWRLFSKKFEHINNTIDIILDTLYIHLEHKIIDLFEVYPNIHVYNINKKKFNANHIVLYIGKNDRKLLNFHLKYSAIRKLYFYDPEEREPSINHHEENSAILKRRHFLIEQIKDSKTIGIVIATVVIENYMKAVDRIKKLLKLNGKKYYILSVGRPTVAKLANFPEMDIYVVICCPMSDIFESRDFYKPIVTAYDIEVALNPKTELLKFSYNLDLGCLDDEIDEDIINEPDVSLLTGNLRYTDDTKEDTTSKDIAVKDEGAVALSDQPAAEFFGKRSFKGLEQKLGESEVKLATEGKSGVPQQYENELY